mmetsp:Transcript_7308/g.7394  ORF Transcript_7308/g.7394 Transcript_7308/m.7394 type:complete len:117 (-) Transcript_7308:199-549(-)
MYPSMNDFRPLLLNCTFLEISKDVTEGKSKQYSSPSSRPVKGSNERLDMSTVSPIAELKFEFSNLLCMKTSFELMRVIPHKVWHDGEREGNRLWGVGLFREGRREEEEEDDEEDSS